MTDEQLRNILNQELAKFAGQLSQNFNERFDKLEAKVGGKADAERIYQTLDRIAKRLDDDDKERTAMNVQLDRHEHWHRQTADTFHLKLDY